MLKVFNDDFLVESTPRVTSNLSTIISKSPKNRNGGKHVFQLGLISICVKNDPVRDIMPSGLGW
jgi:hypothetical protein